MKKSYLSEAGGEGVFNNLSEVKGLRERHPAVQFPCFIVAKAESFEAYAQNLRQREKFDPLKKIFLMSQGQFL